MINIQSLRYSINQSIRAMLSLAAATEDRMSGGGTVVASAPCTSKCQWVKWVNGPNGRRSRRWDRRLTSRAFNPSATFPFPRWTDGDHGDW